LFDRFRDGVGAQRPITPQPAPDADEQALARYRYMLRTAPPEAIEQAHAEAFAQLTPEQRRRVLVELGKEIPESERPVLQRAGDDPAQLARVATRAEIRAPGVMERTFGALPASPGAAAGGMGGLFAGTLLASMAGTVLGSVIAQHFFAHDANAASLFGGGGGLAGEGSLHHAGDRSGDMSADTDADEYGFDDSDAGGGFDAGGDTFDA
jgi:hypothetical protein